MHGGGSERESQTDKASACHSANTPDGLLAGTRERETHTSGEFSPGPPCGQQVTSAVSLGLLQLRAGIGRSQSWNSNAGTAGSKTSPATAELNTYAQRVGLLTRDRACDGRREWN